MFLVKTVDGLVVEQHDNLPLPYVEYVKKSMSVVQVETNKDCIGKIHTDSNILLEAPTLFHTAYKQSWILTVENYLLLSQTVSMTVNKIMSKFTSVFEDSEWFEAINDVGLSKNKIKAYCDLKELLKSAPTYIEIYDL